MNPDALEQRLREVLAASGETEPLSEAETDALAELLASRGAPPESVETWVDDRRSEELLRLYPEIERTVEQTLAVRRTARLRPWMAVAAALVLLAITLPWLLRDTEPPSPQMRTQQTAAIVTPIERGAALDRAAFNLVWEGAPDGSLYALELATGDLRVIHRVSALDEALYRVPVEVFEELHAGETVLWRVEATLPDGSSVASPTFRVRLE